MKYSVLSRIIIVLIIGQMILPIFFQNLPFPFSTFYLYFILFVGFFILTKPIIFITGANKKVIFFALFYLILFTLNIYNKTNEVYNIKWLFVTELLPIFISTLLFAYFVKYSNLVNLIKVVRISLLFILITSITSIVGLYFYPMAARDLAGVLIRDQEFELVEFYKKLGIAGYDFFYGLAFIFPVFVLLLKKQWYKVRYRYIILLLLLIIFYSIIKSQMTSAFLYAIIGASFSFISTKNPKKTLIYFSIILLTFAFIPNHIYVNTLRNISEHVDGETLQNNLYDLSITLEKNFEGIDDTRTHVGQRAERIPFLINQFLTSPLIGGGESTGHVFWFDRLSLFGLLGLIPWVFLLLYNIKSTIKMINKEYVYTYLLTIILFISIGFMKNSGGRIVYFCVFFLAPSILVIYSNNKSILRN